MRRGALVHCACALICGDPTHYITEQLYLRTVQISLVPRPPVFFNVTRFPIFQRVTLKNTGDLGTRLVQIEVTMKKDLMHDPVEVDVIKRKSIDSGDDCDSRMKWKLRIIFVLSVILVVELFVLFAWMPQCWRLRFFNHHKESPYTIEDTMIGGTLNAMNIKNIQTGRF